MEFPYLAARGLLGLAVVIALAVLLSSNRRAINWRLVGIGLALQIVFAVLVLKTEPGLIFFDGLGHFFTALMEFSEEGGKFIFGSLVTDRKTFGYIFAVRVLPSIIFFAAFMSVLYYLGIMQKIVKGLGWFMAKTMRLSGAEALSASADVFLGQTEAPLVVRPYVPTMTRSELFTLMTAGMATLAGGVLLAYVGMLGGDSSEEQARFAMHLLAASLMSVPAAVVLSKIMIPETGTPETLGKFDVHTPQLGRNLIDAAAHGTVDGLRLALNVGAMLIAFIALVALLNALLAWLAAPDLFGWNPFDLNQWVKEISDGNFEAVSLQAITGFLFAPLAWCMGVPAEDILQFGRLLGEKMVLNEFVAYGSLSQIKGSLDARSVIMATYALAGFANFSSIAIQIGGTGSLAPTRQSEIAELGLAAVLCGSLATCMTAIIAGVMVG
jgi:CNT family concentrative nucleoside transporter